MNNNEIQSFSGYLSNNNIISNLFDQFKLDLSRLLQKQDCRQANRILLMVCDRSQFRELLSYDYHKKARLHVELIGLCHATKHLSKLKNKNPNLNFELGFDGIGWLL